MAGLFAWSPTAGSNTSVGGVGINTGMSPANVDNAIRAVLAEIRTSIADDDLETFLAGSAALAIAMGGTGATDAATALSNLGALSSSYRDLPLTTKNAAFTFADSERSGRIRYTGAAAAATINPNASTSITDGAVYVIINAGSGVLTITKGSGVTLKVNGSTSSANGSLAVGGVATLIRDGTDNWYVSGSGLS